MTATNDLERYKKVARIAIHCGIFDPEALRGEETVFETESAMIEHMERA